MVRVYAVRATAVGDVFLAFRKLPETGLQLIDRNGNRACDVTSDILVRGPSIEHHYVAGSHTPKEFLHANRLGTRSIAEMIPDQTIEFRKPVLGHRAYGL